LYSYQNPHTVLYPALPEGPSSLVLVQLLKKHHRNVTA